MGRIQNHTQTSYTSTDMPSQEHRTEVSNVSVAENMHPTIARDMDFEMGLLASNYLSDVAPTAISFSSIQLPTWDGIDDIHMGGLAILDSPMIR